MGEERVGDALEAARSGSLEALLALLDGAPELVSARGDGGTTLLHVAAERDDRTMAEALLDLGADPRARASWGYTAFEWAAAMAADRVARLLLDRGLAELDLWTAAAIGELDFVRSCFEDGRPRPGVGRRPADGADLTGWPPDAPFRTGDVVSDAFHIAARNGRIEVAAYLLERNASVDAIGYFGATGLQWAAVAGREEIVRWLIEKGADPGRRDAEFGSDAAGWAREGGHASLADFLASVE